MQENLPEWITEIAESATKKFRDDIDKATDMATRVILAHPEIEDLKARLIKDAIRGLIYDCRHRTNVSIRKAQGQYGGPAKVGTTTAVGKVSKQLYLDSYAIAGRMLGDILGGELLAIAADQESKEKGAEFNKLLCRKLAKLVPENKTVRQSVSETKVRKLFDELKPSRNLAMAGV